MIDLTTMLQAFGIGLGVWFITWGLNRVYLFAKSLIS